jgi:hypothetical protein
MPKVQVDHRSTKNASDLLQLIQDFFYTDTDMRKIDSKIQCHFDPQKLSGRVTGSQFKAEIRVSPQSPGSLISVIVDLPLLLTPLKGKVEKILKEKLEKHLA